jgi:peptide/nickel transport system permease protein
MQAYLARRLLALIPALFFASLIVFVIVRLVPGSIIDMMLSQNDVGADKLSRDQLINTLGLDRPMWEQYARWIGGILLHGDFGRSLWQNTPVAELLRARMPVTFQLGLMAMIVALCVAIPIGIYSAIRQDTPGDYLARSFSILMLAVPSFWMGTMVMVFPSIWWGWSPQVRFVAFFDDPVQNLRQMILPAIILGTALSAITMRMTRTMMLEVLRQDYIRTAWAKGLSERLVVAVMYGGRIVEVAPARELYARPHHPYTLGLMASVPRLDGGRRLVPIEGQPPDLASLPPGCSFAPRCRSMIEPCRHARPELTFVADRHAKACFADV